MSISPLDILVCSAVDPLFPASELFVHGITLGDNEKRRPLLLVYENTLWLQVYQTGRCLHSLGMSTTVAELAFNGIRYIEARVGQRGGKRGMSVPVGEFYRLRDALQTLYPDEAGVISDRYNRLMREIDGVSARMLALPHPAPGAILSVMSAEEAIVDAIDEASDSEPAVSVDSRIDTLAEALARSQEKQLLAVMQPFVEQLHTLITNSVATGEQITTLTSRVDLHAQTINTVIDSVEDNDNELTNLKNEVDQLRRRVTLLERPNTSLDISPRRMSRV